METKDQDQEREFVSRVCEMAAVKVKYAIERNIPRILEDIQRQQEFFGDNERPGSDKIDVTLSLCVERPLPHYARLTVTGVSWATKVRRKDADFEAGEVDIDAPYLPGMETTMGGKAPSQDTPALAEIENIAEKNLLTAAHDLKKKVYRTCRDWDNPNRARSVDQWTGKEWRTVLCEDKTQAARALTAAEDMGLLVIAHGLLTTKTVELLSKAGYDICHFFSDGVKIADVSLPGLYKVVYGSLVPEPYRDQAAYRAAGGLELMIYEPEPEDNDHSADAEQADDAQGDDAEQADDALQDALLDEYLARGYHCNEPCDDAELGADAQGDDAELEDAGQASKPLIAIERNARRLHDKGFNVAYMDRDEKTIHWRDWDPKFNYQWKKTDFSTKKEAKEFLRELRDNNFIDPEYPALAADFTIIRGPVRRVSVNKAPYAIRKMSANGGWTIHSKYDTAGQALAAYRELLKDPMVLEG